MKELKKTLLCSGLAIAVAFNPPYIRMLLLLYCYISTFYHPISKPGKRSHNYVSLPLPLTDTGHSTPLSGAIVVLFFYSVFDTMKDSAFFEWTHL
jgi:hypothetical protein